MLPAHRGRWGCRAAGAVLALLALGAGIAQGQTLPAPQAAPAAVLDVLRVRAQGRAADAVVQIPAGPEHRFDCDAVIIGAGMGGVSAALEAARSGLTVCLTEPTRWIGGQMTSQGVSAFDDNHWIATTGATATFADLSRRIRASYAQQLPAGRAEALSASGSMAGFNPGQCWVSQLCFEPRRGLAVLQELMAPGLKSGRIHLWLHTVPVRVARSGPVLSSVLAYDFDLHRWLRLQGKYFVDASATGDLLALSGLPFRSGAESRGQTGEPDAPAVPDPSAVQSITYPFLLQRRDQAVVEPNGHPPPGYDQLKPRYTFVVDYGHGKRLTYQMFARTPGTPGSFWTYRRVVAAAQFRGPQPGGALSASGAGDIATINWSSNDDCDAQLLSRDPDQQAEGLQHAKQVSLGFAWWLRHDAPRDGGRGHGYPELVLLPGGMGSADGLSQQPYIRESRRILPLRTIVEQSIAVKFQPGARAQLYPDTVGIGQYPIDIHSCGGHDFTSQTKPYEIPLGALIARNAKNLMAASLDLGTTHITNGAYRLHPTLWAVGEAVGATLAQAVRQRLTPAQIDARPAQVRILQRTLVQQGHPVFWFDDVPSGSPVFAAAQISAAWSWLSVNRQNLHFDAQAQLSGAAIAGALEKSGWANRVPASGLQRLKSSAVPTWPDLRALRLPGVEDSGPVRKGNFAEWLLRISARHRP